MRKTNIRKEIKTNYHLIVLQIFRKKVNIIKAWNTPGHTSSNGQNIYDMHQTIIHAFK